VPHQTQKNPKIKKLIIIYLSWNKLMPLVVMKELFLAFGFKFQVYIPRDKNDENLKKSFVIVIF
jgi:hypothetical protein